MGRKNQKKAVGIVQKLRNEISCTVDEIEQINKEIDAIESCTNDVSSAVCANTEKVSSNSFVVELSPLIPSDLIRTVVFNERDHVLYLTIDDFVYKSTYDDGLEIEYTLKEILNNLMEGEPFKMKIKRYGMHSNILYEDVYDGCMVSEYCKSPLDKFGTKDVNSSFNVTITYDSEKA